MKHATKNKLAILAYTAIMLAAWGVLAFADETPIPASGTPIAAVLFKLCDGSKFAAIVLPDGSIDVEPYSPELSAALQKAVPKQHARLVDACGDPAYKGGTPTPAPAPETADAPKGLVKPVHETACQRVVEQAWKTHLQGSTDVFCATI